MLSACSYLVDYFHLQGYLRWSLILLFMMLKAGLIVAVFMHMAWERLALVYAILVPPVAVLVFVAIMVLESEHTLLSASPSSEPASYDTKKAARFPDRTWLHECAGIHAAGMQRSCRCGRLHHTAIEVPGGMTEHRHHDGEPDEERDRADEESRCHDQSPHAPS